MEVMASTSASSTSLSATSDSFDVESDIDSETEPTVCNLCSLDLIWQVQRQCPWACGLPISIVPLLILL